MNIRPSAAVLALALFAGSAFAATSATPAAPATPAVPAAKAAAPVKHKLAHACKKGETLNNKGKCDKSKASTS